MSISWPNFIDRRDQARTFAGIAVTTGGGSEIVLGGSRPARVPDEGISRGYFDVRGIRIAPGPDPREVPSMIVRYAMNIALAGLAAGAVAALLLATAWIATILPAHRSTRIDPMVSMRAE